MLTIQPSEQDKEERKTALSATMARLLERIKVLDASVIDKANEILPNLVSLWSDFSVVHWVEEKFWSASLNKDLGFGQFFSVLVRIAALLC